MYDREKLANSMKGILFGKVTHDQVDEFIGMTDMVSGYDDVYAVARDFAANIKMSTRLQVDVLGDIIGYTVGLPADSINMLTRNKLADDIYNAYSRSLAAQEVVVEVILSDGSGYSIDCGVNPCATCDRDSLDYFEDNGDGVITVVKRTIRALNDDSLVRAVEDWVMFDKCDCHHDDTGQWRDVTLTGDYNVRAVTREDANPDFENALVFGV